MPFKLAEFYFWLKGFINCKFVQFQFLHFHISTFDIDEFRIRN
jgi:hypothetical protein